MLFQKNKISQIFYQILCCGYSLESTRGDDSNEYPQHKIWKMLNGFKVQLLPPNRSIE